MVDPVRAADRAKVAEEDAFGWGGRPGRMIFVRAVLAREDSGLSILLS